MIGRAVAALIRVYQLSLGRLTGGRCRFHPSCSEYSRIAFRDRGAVVGAWLTARRLVRCGPWTRGGVDHVPARRPVEVRHG